MDKNDVKKMILVLWDEYINWNDKRHKDKNDPSKYLSFAGFIYWLNIKEEEIKPKQ